MILNASTLLHVRGHGINFTTFFMLLFNPLTTDDAIFKIGFCASTKKGCDRGWWVGVFKTCYAREEGPISSLLMTVLPSQSIL